MVRSPGLHTVFGARAVRRRSVAPVLLAWSVALLVIGAGSLGVAAAVAPPAAAHTDLLQASPGPGQRAGGEIDFVDLAFLEPVSDATVDVVHDGGTVAGSMVTTDGSIIRFEFDEPLASAGTYDVSYAMTSADLDATTGRFTFTFEPSAPQAVRIGTVGPEPRNWVPVIATGVLIVALAGAAFLLLGRLEARRRAATEATTAAPDQSQADAP